MLYDVKRQAYESARLAYTGHIREALASLTTFTVLFNDLASVSLLKASSLLSQHILPPSADGMLTDWSQVAPHTSLQWQPCFNNFHCARLRVPMDWHRNTTEAQLSVDLALIKIAATVPVSHPNYGGAIVVSAGLPGSSGVDQIMQGGHALRTMASAGLDAGPAALHFDIIGFDARGINNSRPFVSCFANQGEEAAWHIEKNAAGLIGASDRSFDLAWARARGLADSCSRRLAAHGIGKHMSTAAIARDVVEIIERHGEWRQVEAQRLLRAAVLSAQEQEGIQRRTRYAKGAEKIRYWGFSYGTVLGAHLAAMYPDRVERMVHDGVVDTQDYMAGIWKANLQDSDAVFIAFAEYCWKGGEARCAMWDKAGPSTIMHNVLDTMAAFQADPITWPGDAKHGPALISYDDLELLMLDIVRSPLTFFPILSDVLSQLREGIVDTLASIALQKSRSSYARHNKACDFAGPFSFECHNGSSARQCAFSPATLCSDALPRTSQTKSDFKDYANELMAQSSLIGASWSEMMLPCTTWHARPTWRYDGTFIAETAQPMLYLANSHDGITPSQNAVRMAAAFAGSLVLQQDGMGHGSYASPSMCTARAVRDYFQTGRLPELATSAGCAADLKPLQGYVYTPRHALPNGETDIQLWQALISLNNAWS